MRAPEPPDRPGPSTGLAHPADGPLAWALDSVVRGYAGTPVLNGVTLAPPPGSVVGLVGVNGSGKSTMLRILVGLLRCDAGRATLGGASAWDPPDAVKERLGYVEQQPDFFAWLTGRYLLRYFGSFYARWDEALLHRLAAAWELPLDRSFGNLSPGNRQKLALLVAMGHRPGLLVLDEPASALDPAARRAVLQRLVDLATDEEEHGGAAPPSVLLSSHLTSDIERVASHVAVLHGGRIRRFEELGELKESVARIRVSAPGPLAADFADGLNDVLRVERSHGDALVVVERAPDEAARRLSGTPGVEAVRVEPMNLEDLFLELVGKAGAGL